MIRLFAIRIFETFFRHPILYMMPALVLGLYGILTVVLEKPGYLTSTVIYIRPNQTLEDLTERSQNDRNVYFTLAEITADELNALFQSEQFMRTVLSRINLSDPAFYISAMDDEAELFDYLAENTVAFPTSEFKVDIVVISESPYLAEAIATEVYPLYLERKIERSMADSTLTEELVTVVLDNYESRLLKIEGELSDYLEAHPVPQTFGLTRRDIETYQISRLQGALEQVNLRKEAAIRQLDSTDLIQFTTESVVRQTFLLLDAPYEPIKLTSRTAQLMQIIQTTALGVVVGFIWTAAVALFNQKFILPIDVVSRTNLPVLSVIVADPALKQQTRWQRLWATVWPQRRRVATAGRERTAPPLPPRWRRNTRVAKS